MSGGAPAAGHGRPAKVLLVASNFPPVRGGSAVVYDSLARHADGHIVVLAPRIFYADGLPLTGWREHDRLAPYRIERLSLLRTLLASPPGFCGRVRRIAADLRIRLGVLRAIRRVRARENVAAICIGELLASAWLIRLLARRGGLRVVVYVHGEEITTEDPYDPGHRRALRALRAAHGVVVVSRFTERAVHALMGAAARDKVRLIENGVDGRRFTPGPRRADLIARFGLEDRFVFVSVCRLLEKKGIDHALAAFAAMGSAAAECRFLVVGAGPYGAALAAQAAALGIAGQVIFAGQVSETDLVDCYRLGDVFVMPNRRLANGDTEGFGLVFLEANGCGVPVIAGRDGGSVDAVTDGVNGLVVDGHDIAAIAAAMRRLHGDTALRARLRQGGLDAAAAADWSGKARAFLAFCAG